MDCTGARARRPPSLRSEAMLEYDALIADGAERQASLPAWEGSDTDAWAWCSPSNAPGDMIPTDPDCGLGIFSGRAARICIADSTHYTIAPEPAVPPAAEPGTEELYAEYVAAQQYLDDSERPTDGWPPRGEEAGGGALLPFAADDAWRDARRRERRRALELLRQVATEDPDVVARREYHNAFRRLIAMPVPPKPMTNGEYAESVVAGQRELDRLDDALALRERREITLTLSCSRAEDAFRGSEYLKVFLYVWKRTGRIDWDRTTTHIRCMPELMNWVRQFRPVDVYRFSEPVDPRALQTITEYADQVTHWYPQRIKCRGDPLHVLRNVLRAAQSWERTVLTDAGAQARLIIAIARVLLVSRAHAHPQETARFRLMAAVTFAGLPWPELELKPYGFWFHTLQPPNDFLPRPSYALEVTDFVHLRPTAAR